MASADAPIAARFASVRGDGAKSHAMAKRSSRPKADEAVGAKAWVFVAPNQLHRGLGALREADPATTGVLLVESREWLSRRPFHRMRVALILLNMRHFADELSQLGFEVRLLRVQGPMAPALHDFALANGPLRATEWCEREMRAEFAGLVQDGLLKPEPDDGWATHRTDFEGCRRGRQWSMDAFYRAWRKRTGVLMDDAGEPEGGRLSFDVENRQRWLGVLALDDRGHLTAPRPSRLASRTRRGAVRWPRSSSASTPRIRAGSTWGRCPVRSSTRSGSGCGRSSIALRTSVRTRTP